MGDITNNFSRHEFRCRCGCGTTNIDCRYVTALQGFREWLGKPIVPTSGCRCPKHNVGIGGAQHSKHLATAAEAATASDITVAGYTSRKLMAALEEYDTDNVFTGRGVYTGNFIHADIGHSALTRWVRRNGVYTVVDSFIPLNPE